MRIRSNLTGKKFNMLTAVKDAGVDKQGNCLWEFRCDCGNTTVVSGSVVARGRTKSCGCLKKVGYRRLPKGEAAFNNLYETYKYGAKRRKLELTLSKDEFRELTIQHCYYCGTEPIKEHVVHGANGAYVYNGIDRLDNSQGYIEGNCVPCCWECNRWKMTSTQEEFMNRVIKIYENCISLVN